MLSVAVVLVSLFLFLFKKRGTTSPLPQRISWGHTCLEFVTTSVYFNLIGPMKVSAKQITSSTHSTYKEEESLGRSYQYHSWFIRPLSHTILCFVHKPYMGHVAGLGPRVA
jgi:hypothetical protein